MLQIAPRDPTKPPLVFHYVPVLGCAVSYGMDPMGFLDDCRAKVRAATFPSAVHHDAEGTAWDSC